ncbi:hypothetical protein SCUP515_12899 [Seiridium cupressi]
MGDHAQLLLAQVDFASPGMYDVMSSGTLEAKIELARPAMAADFDLHSIPLYRESEPPIPSFDRHLGPDDIADDIQFLVDVLNPRPHIRPTAPEILQTGYLKVE